MKSSRLLRSHEELKHDPSLERGGNRQGDETAKFIEGPQGSDDKSSSWSNAETESDKRGSKFSSLISKIRTFLAQHPALRDALAWVIPAILFGAVLRLLMLHYSPFAYWGADSRSYYDFTYKLFVEHFLSLNEKRRVLYPILMALVTALPGTPLKWVAWLQHGFGLLTLIPLAYVVRKAFNFWRIWIVPVTVLYASLPVVLWYEHEMLGETLFFALVVWAFAGWVAWAQEGRRERAAQLFWLFFVPFALFILTKPSGRFYWPGLLTGFVLIAAWHKLRRIHYVALGTLMVVTLMVGSKQQGAWLFYVASFPLTQLDTPLHAEYKAEIRDMVNARRERIAYYHAEDDEPFEFTRNPRAHSERPLWAALADNTRLQQRIHMDLALEGIKAEPLKFLYLGFQRVVFSTNLSTFKAERFEADYMSRRFQDDYEEAIKRLRDNRQSPIPLVLGYSQRGPLPPYEEVRPQLSPAPESFAARAVTNWVNTYLSAGDLVRVPEKGKVEQARPTLLGWWLLAAFALSFTRAYRSTVGVWALAALGYIAGVFLVSQVNPRYFGAAWPVFIPLLAVPADVLCRTAVALFARRRESPASQ